MGYWLRLARSCCESARNDTKCDNFFPCFAGLEFECYRGHRFILDYYGILRHARHHFDHISLSNTKKVG